MTDIEPAIRKALRPRIGNVERRTRYLLDAHAVAVAAAVARERKQADDAQRVMADDINRIAAERDEARETAAGLATVWDRERETMAAHIGALEADLERANGTLAATIDEHHGVVERLQGERDHARRQVGDLDRSLDSCMNALGQAEAGRDEAAAERDRLQGHLTAAEQRIEELRAEFPATPGCGCRAPNEPDQRECGCDAGCNDGENAPGVQVLMDERDRLREQLATSVDITAVRGYRIGDQIHDPRNVEVIVHRDDAPPAAQTPAPGARSAPRGRRAARTGPGKGAEAAEAPGAAESGGSETK